MGQCTIIITTDFVQILIFLMTELLKIQIQYTKGQTRRKYLCNIRVVFYPRQNVESMTCERKIKSKVFEN